MITNGPRLRLGQVLVPPERVLVILRSLKADQISDELINVWLVGKEPSDGYRIVMRDDGKEFGLASKGFPSDEHLVLVAWYSDLVSAFMSM